MPLNWLANVRRVISFHGILPPSGPCSSASQSASPVRTRPWVLLPPRAPSRKGSGQMRSLSRKQVGVARALWARVPPLPPCRGSPTDTTPGPQPGSRGSTPRRGTNRRASQRSAGETSRSMPDRLTGRTSDCYSDCGGSSPPLAAHRPVAEDRGTGLQTGIIRHASFQVHGSQNTWSSSNGENASTPCL